MTQNNKVSQTILLVTSYTLLVTMIGCDAFVRKFTRKPKKENIPQEEMVLVPEEYKQTMTKEEVYRQYLLFWKTWQDELIEALLRSSNHKKQVGCIEQAIKNLVQLRSFLNVEKQKKLDAYLEKMKNLKAEIREDTYSQNAATNRLTAERLRRAILKDFSYHQIKDSLA